MGKEEAVEGQITTRDLRDIKIEVEDGVLKDEKILLYEFIETKEPDCLANVLSYMKENDKNMNSGAKKLLKTFEDMVGKNKPGARRNV